MDARVGPALLYGGMLSAFLLFSHSTFATLLLVQHVARRLFEIFFVHEYTRKSPPGMLAVPVFYSLYAIWLARSAEFASGYYMLGLGVWIIGELGNAYHHLLLRGKSRSNPPKAGLFNILQKPNYFFEMLTWTGFSIIFPTYASFGLLVVSFLAMSSLIKSTPGDTRKKMIPFVY